MRAYRAQSPLVAVDGSGNLHVRPEQDLVIDWGNYADTAPAVTPPPPAPDKPAPPVAPELASRTARVVAALADMLLGQLPWMVGLWLLGDSSVRPDIKTYGAFAVVLASVALVVVQIVLLSVRGQTLGKIALGVRVVNYLDGHNPGFWRAVGLRSFVPALIACVPVLGQIFVLFDFLGLLGADRRCLHDILADTKVVEA